MAVLRRTAHLFLVMCLMPSWLLSACSAGSGGEGVDRGERLFRGQAALSAGMQGQGVSLTADTARCVNCHALPTAGVGASAAASSTDAQALGPNLFGGSLTTATRRRGGPPSLYGPEGFCRALRTGIDPAHVTLVRSMPVYVMSDEDCLAIWSFLTRPL